MSEDARPNPRMVPPGRDPRLHPAPARTLVEELGEVADELRQLHTDFGTRPYRVFVVVTAWSGGEPDRGIETVVHEEELLPTPCVDLRPVRRRASSGGKIEAGSVRLTEVSPRYTEDQIHGLFHVKRPAAQTAFVEVRHDARDGETQRRRFWVNGAPWRDAEGFQWIVPLSVQQQARTRAGELQGAARPRRRPPHG